MKTLNKIDHIGYAVHDIAETARHYVEAGWVLSPIYDETVQNTSIAFLTKPGFIKIELVAPPVSGANSPIDNTLKNQGVAPYHICYEVDDVMESVEILFEEGFRPLFFPVESVAMENRKICYLYHLEVGTIEIVNKQ